MWHCLSISTAGTDYDATSNDLLFVGAPQQLCVQINITDNSLDEPRESFLVMLSTMLPSEFVSLNPQFISVIITDDDSGELTVMITYMYRTSLVICKSMT